MKRLQSQAIGESAEDLVTYTFSKSGWVAEKCQRDYGIDLVVQPCKEFNLTGQFVLLQVKARSKRYFENDLYKIRVSVKDALFWAKIPLPLYLVVVYQDPTEIFIINYHNFIKNIEDSREDWKKKKTINVLFPENAKLTENRFLTIRNEINNRYDILRNSVVYYNNEKGARYILGEICRPDAFWDSQSVISSWAGVISKVISEKVNIDEIPETNLSWLYNGDRIYKYIISNWINYYK